MLRTATLAALCLILAFPTPSPAARATGEDLRQLDLTVLPRLLESYEQSRHVAKRALRLYEQRGIQGLLAQADRDLETASRPPKRISAIAHEWYAASAWFHGVLALVRNEPQPGENKPLHASAGLPASRAGAFFRLDTLERARLLALTKDIFATAAQRLAEEHERSAVFMLRYGAGKKSIDLFERGSRSGVITVAAPSGDATILLEGCAEGAYCHVTYIGDGDGDFKRVKTARHARKSD